MLSKNKIKYVKSLQLKKYRLQERKFVLEGDKIVKELTNSSYEIEAIFATKNWIEKHSTVLQPFLSIVFESDSKQLKAASNLKTVSQVLALVKMPRKIDTADQQVPFHLYLDSIRDPGNLGTLIRSASWFGLPQICCSPDCVDFFNSKVLQASMGAFMHIDLLSSSIAKLTSDLPQHSFVGATLAGTAISQFEKPEKMVLIIGNEGKGISPSLLAACHQQITIPKGKGSAEESLNAAVSGSILLSHLL